MFIDYISICVSVCIFKHTGFFVVFFGLYWPRWGSNLALSRSRLTPFSSIYYFKFSGKILLRGEQVLVRGFGPHCL